MIERIRDLQEQIVQLKAWETEKQRYEFKTFGGGVACFLKPETQGTEPMHPICANCYARGKISYLAKIPDDAIRAARNAGTVYQCFECPTKIGV